MPSERAADSDSALLDAYRSGDDSALRALLERYEPAVYRFGVKMCRDPEDAKDVLQDTLLAAARGARSYRGGSSISTWLYAIARSFCIKARRRRSGAPAEEPLESDEVRELPAGAALPDERAHASEIGAALDAAIGELAPAYREVLILRDVEGLSAGEVADVLGIGVDAVKSRLHRARVAVRERIAPLLAPVTMGGSPQYPPAQPAEPPEKPGCPDVVGLLSRYLEGEIGPAECEEMNRHVAACARCTGRCDSLKRTLSLCRASADAGAVPPEVQARIREALRRIA